MNALKFHRPAGLDQDMQIVPVTRELVHEMYQRQIPWTVTGCVFIKNSKPVAIAGIKYEHGLPVLFSDISPGADVSPVTVWRCSKMIVAEAKKFGRPIYCYVKTGAFSSQRMIQRLGFKLINAEPEVETYVHG